ncbi:hypothetical protein GCM10007886_09690 [Methylobacterium gregans]|nr:hypothetical protein GCM10007886_09690 [Methylobacterium gregans]
MRSVPAWNVTDRTSDPPDSVADRPRIVSERGTCPAQPFRAKAIGPKLSHSVCGPPRPYGPRDAGPFLEKVTG